MRTPYYIKHLIHVVLFIAILFSVCEFLIYYIVFNQCLWPQLDKNNADVNIKVDETPLRIMFISDTHLLGPRRGYFIDKLLREWQMRRAFQTAIALHSPEIVFVLGDLFDEGQWGSDKLFLSYVKKFHDIFQTPENTDLFAVVGNHDIGFHYWIKPNLEERFSNAFNLESVQLMTLKGNHFVLLNGMAMEGDGCFLCKPAEIKLKEISEKLKCANSTVQCKHGNKPYEYSRPILLQHFPLYRKSDEECNEPDSATGDEKVEKFKEKWDCLSNVSSKLLLDSLRPRLIFTGHTHHGCLRYYEEYDTFEHTIPSFNWRNKNNPSFTLAVIAPNNYALSKCYMPQQSTVIILYSLGAVGILCYLIWVYIRQNRSYQLAATEME